jgi:hypothetical protein
MAYEDVPEIVVDDPADPAFTELSSLTEGLLLDAGHSFDFIPPEESLAAEGVIDRRADYVLDGDAIGEDMSRYIGVAIDRFGVQVAMLPFSEADTVTVPVPGENPDIEIIQGIRAGSLVCVDFFSYAFEPAGVRLEGVESEASRDDLAHLTAAMKHPELQEINTDRQTLRYAPITLRMIEGAATVREVATKEFFIRKSTQLLNHVAENEDRMEQRTTAEAELKIKQAELAASEARLADLEWKVAHPVRGTLKDITQRLFRR